jgi:replicative DNA helicase
MIDQLPPHNLEAEAGALACAVLDPPQTGELSQELFYDLRHQTIAGQLIEMAAKGSPISPATLVTNLTAAGLCERAGGIQYVAELAQQTPSAANMPYYLEILQEMAALRSIARVGQDYASRAMEPGADSKALVEGFGRDALAVDHSSAGAGDGNLKSQVEEALHEFEECAEHSGQLRGLTSGFPDLDRLTAGFRPGQLVIIGARPSVGKTSLAMNIAERVAVDGGISTAVFSLEMSTKELLFRMLCCRARVDSMAATRGLTDRDSIARILAAGQRIKKAPLQIVDTGGLTIAKLSSIARKLSQRHRIRLLIVDYLQLLRCESRSLDNRTTEITRISNGLKLLARELNCVVIAPAQLNRDLEKDKRAPRLSDLRDSGSLEQDADIVGLLHRDVNADGDVVPVELNIAKNRNGPTGKVHLVFRKSFTRFESAALPERPAIDCRSESVDPTEQD